MKEQIDSDFDFFTSAVEVGGYTISSYKPEILNQLWTEADF